MAYRCVANVMFAVVTLAASAALADGIDPGLWKITTHTESDGVAGPTHESSKCLTAEQTNDLGATFSPVATTINSDCAPMERSLKGPLLTWHLVCTGQLNMELSGSFDFDSPHHYTGTVQSKAEMQGMPNVDSQNTIEGEWVSACPQQ
ncbi:MAG TPA: DUF3617 family protein [Xanthobacteraceae bacterium]|nr:DUF3617 family protein [Xanthobacteraceae bacterium]